MRANDISTFLIIDKEERLCSALEEFLVKDGYRVETALSRDQALKILLTKRIDVVILGAAIVAATEYELLKTIKKKFSQIPVILAIEHKNTASIKKALLHGADEYISLPLKQHEITAITERVVWRLAMAEDLELE